MKLGILTMAHFPELRALSTEEIEDFFCETGKEWSVEDREYLLAWYRRIPLVELAYALSRTPPSVSQQYRTLKGANVVVEMRLHKCSYCGTQFFVDKGRASWCPHCGYEGDLFLGPLYRFQSNPLPEDCKYETSAKKL